MGKYIIELENDQIIDGHITCPMQIGYRDRPSFIIDTGIDITPYTEPDLEQIRKEAYQQGYEQGYKDGYNEPGKWKIQVGDEIETPSGLKGYVVNFTDDELVHYVSSEGRFGTMGTSAVSKTGRHFPEIAEVLQKMKES